MEMQRNRPTNDREKDARNLWMGLLLLLGVGFTSNNFGDRIDGVVSCQSLREMNITRDEGIALYRQIDDLNAEELPESVLLLQNELGTFIADPNLRSDCFSIRLVDDAEEVLYFEG